MFGWFLFLFLVLCFVGFGFFNLFWIYVATHHLFFCPAFLLIIESNATLKCLHGLSLILKLQEEVRLSSHNGLYSCSAQFPQAIGVAEGLFHDRVICL